MLFLQTDVYQRMNLIKQNESIKDDENSYQNKHKSSMLIWVKSITLYTRLLFQNLHFSFLSNPSSCGLSFFFHCLYQWFWDHRLHQNCNLEYIWYICSLYNGCPFFVTFALRSGCWNSMFLELVNFWNIMLLVSPKSPSIDFLTSDELNVLEKPSSKSSTESSLSFLGSHSAWL